jgi:hypothetical protein
METEEKELTQEESLRIIHDMIAAAKSEVSENSFTYLLWGWLVFIASTAQFVLVKLDVPWNGIVWLLMPLGGIITALYFIKKKKESRVKTTINDWIKYTWISFAIALMIVMLFNNTMTALQVIPCIMILYGMGLFQSGGALKFRPLIYGGIFCWVCAIAGFQIQNVYQLLILAAAVLGGYIIPGHLLKMNNRK